MPVIMMSGHATIDTAVDATRIGAFAFLENPSPCRNCSRQWSRVWYASRSVRLHQRLWWWPVHRPSTVPSMRHKACLSPWRRTPARMRTRVLTSIALAGARDGFEKAYFEFHLAREGGSMTRVAEKTGLERTHLYRKLRQLGVDLARGKRN